MSGANRARRLPRTVAPLGAETRTSKKNNNIYERSEYILLFLPVNFNLLFILLLVLYISAVIYLFIILFIYLLYLYIIIILYILYIIYYTVGYHIFLYLSSTFLKKFLSPLYSPCGERKIGSKPPIGPYLSACASSSVLN